MFLEKLQNKIKEWRDEDYKGAKPETENLLRYIKQVGFLYNPQFEAFESYVYLKEIENNKPLIEVFKSFYPNEKELLFEGLGISKKEAYDYWDDKKKINNLLKERFDDNEYTNQVYALTMGAGKTLLMGLFMIYDFILSFYYPNDERFAKNVLLFAPDKTIIESLKEIKNFDWQRIIPREYKEILLNIKYHYLEDLRTNLVFIGNYNIIVSNSQKIILKRRKTSNSQIILLDDIKLKEAEERENKRLRAIRELKNLIVFVDEAHHSFGKNLEGGLKKVKTTIDYLNKEGKTKIKGVINLTGTPYIEGKMIDDVVFYYGLKQGIKEGILKQVDISNYGNVRSKEFVYYVLNDFFEKYQNERLEGKLPKIAFYSPNIEVLQKELRPVIEKYLIDKKKKIDLILEYHTKTEENKEEFNKLDTEKSKKQIILLVGKGVEGWNCKSLISVALYKKPTSNIFVLQATTRALRAVSDNNKKASIFLSNENFKILDNELKKNFNISTEDLEEKETEIFKHTLRVEKFKTLILKRKIKNIIAIKNENLKNIKIDIKKYNKDNFYYIQQAGIYIENDEVEYTKENKKNLIIKNDLTIYEIFYKLSSFTKLKYLELKEILRNNKFNDKKLLKMINEDIGFLVFLSDEILRQVFKYDFEYKEFDEEVKLTKKDSFEIELNENKNNLVVYKKDVKKGRLGFHINPYNFDSREEINLFKYLRNELEKNEVIKDIYFTGGLDNPSNTDFYFEYHNPDENLKISKYYPDFLIETSKRYLVVEVKGKDKEETYQANKKKYKGKITDLFDNTFSKEIGFKEFQEINKNFDYKIIFNAGLQQQQKKLFDFIRKYEKV
jgi:hypothetical protein